MEYLPIYYPPPSITQIIPPPVPWLQAAPVPLIYLSLQGSQVCETNAAGLRPRGHLLGGAQQCKKKLIGRTKSLLFSKCKEVEDVCNEPIDSTPSNSDLVW